MQTGFSADQIESARADTPGVRNIIHLNNAGSALPPSVVTERQIAHLMRESEIGGYEAAAEASEELSSVYDKVADLMGARRHEIALVENATVGWQMVFYGMRFSPGDRILTSEAEYGANYVAFLHRARENGLTVDVIPSNESGETSVKALDAMIDTRVKLIAITHIPTNSGLVNPASKLGAIARAHGIPFLLDACQSAGHIPLDVGELGCDFLTASARKYMRGPRGSGFLYVRENWLDHLHPPVIDHYSANWISPERYKLRDDAGRFENWENNYAARAGLGVAVDYINSIGMPVIWDRIQSLADHLRSGLAGIPGVTIRDIGSTKCGIVTFTINSQSAFDIKEKLSARGINVSVSDPSSTLLDSTRRQLPPVVRASVHYYNSIEELNAALVAVSDIAGGK